MGGKAAAAAIYPNRLCCAICKGLAAQVAEDIGNRITTLPMTSARVSSLSLLCQEATGRSALSAIKIESENVAAPLGRYRRERPAGITKIPGAWPEHWVDPVHELDGHGINAVGEDRAGEELLNKGLSTLYVQNGITHAVDDVSGAALDPEVVRQGREVEMTFFETMGVYERVPRSEQAQTGGKIIGTK